LLLEGLGQLKNSDDLNGNQTRNLPACSIVPQPTTLPRAPQCKHIGGPQTLKATTGLQKYQHVSVFVQMNLLLHKLNQHIKVETSEQVGVAVML
jgi:hypothetical protein